MILQLAIDYDYCARKHQQNVNSQRAYEKAKQFHKEQAILIFEWLLLSPALGLTTHELGGLLAKTHPKAKNDFSGRLTELAKSGVIARNQIGTSMFGKPIYESRMGCAVWRVQYAKEA